MKTIAFILAGTMLLSVAVYGKKISESKVPSAVINTFNTQYPEASRVSWEKDTNEEFMAFFMLNKLMHFAKYDKDGNWVETAVEMDPDDFPEMVVQALSSQFPDYGVYQAAMVKSNNSATYYRAIIDNGIMKYDVNISEDGKLIQEKALVGMGY